MTTRIWKGLHLLLLVSFAVVIGTQYALPAAVAAAAVGTALGVVAGNTLASARLRTALCFALCFAGASLALLFRFLLLRSAALASFAGPEALYALGDLILWFFLSLSVVTCLETLAARKPSLRALELVVAGGAFAALFAAHRGGFIDRPFGFVDLIWSRGRDPLGYFLLLGAGLALLLALMLVQGSRSRRSAVGVLSILVVVMALFLLLPQGQLKRIVELHRVMGSDGKDQAAKQGDKGKEGAKDDSPSGEEGASGKRNDQSGLPETFSDESAGHGNSPLAVVVFHSDFKPPLGYYYFRETAFSAFNGGRLVRDTSGRYDPDVVAGFSQGTVRVPSSGLPFSATQIPGVKGAAFAQVPTTVALLAPHPRPFGLVNPEQFAPVQNPDPRRFFRAFAVTSSALTVPLSDLLAEKGGGRGWSDATWRHYTEGPADPRFAELAERVISGLPPRLQDEPFARAVAIKLWLDKHGTYSLTSTHEAAPDPVSDFLFGDLTGHCVFFAHAASLLYRAAGVPSRVATGYAVRADFMGGGASLLIRSKDAHAWPEICLRDTGWLPLDISPEKVLSQPEEAPDQGLQQLLGAMAMKARPPSQPPPAEQEEPSPWEAAKRFLAAALWALLFILCLLIPACYAVKLWRRWIPYAGGRRLPLTAYRASLDLLAEAGFRRSFGESREAFASRIGARFPAFRDFTSDHLRFALGSPGRREPTSDWLSLYRSVRVEVNGGLTGARRLLAAIHPLAWWRVH